MTEAAHKPNNEVTYEGEQKIKRWLAAQEGEQRAKNVLNRAECETVNAHNELAKWMIPSDAKVGEKICVWYGDSLIQVEIEDGSPPGRYIVTVRKRGRSLNLVR
jgi:hypothetical protein